MITVKLRKTHNSDLDLQLPAYATQGSSGLDLRYYGHEIIELSPMQRKLIPTGLSLELPQGYEAQIRPRSGLAYEHGITLLNTPGTIDSDYRGEIKVLLINLGESSFTVTPGMRIAQMIISRYERVEVMAVDRLEESSRNTGGFGSTGTD